MASRTQEMDTLMEEIGYQKAILASLKDAQDPASQAARDSARKELRLLATRLTHLQMQTRNPSKAAQSPAASQNARSDPRPESTAQPSPVSTSLPNRKREFGQRGSPTRPGSHPKLRKTEAMSNASDLLDSDNLEIIDLTGDDVDTASSYVAAQMMQEKRAAQRRQDREMAERLSEQHSAQQPSPVRSQPTDPRADPLQKLMLNARTNGAPSSSLPDAGSIGLPVGQQGLAGQSALPGNSQPTRFADKDRLDLIRSIQMAELARQQSIQMQRMSTQQREAIRYQQELVRRQQLQQLEQLRRDPYQLTQLPGAFPASNMYSAPQHRPSSFLPPPAPPHPALTSAVVPPAVLGSTNWATIPSNGPSSSMRDIINRSSGFVSGNMAGFGYPTMPDRLSSFLDFSEQDERMTDKELEELLQNIRPDQEIPLNERCEYVEGLQVNIYHHQQLALKWMQGMEEGSNKGGILADDMGLGKTISTLALIITRRATTRPKTNLIIGPVALIRQWEEEIKAKTASSHRLSVFVYHGKKTTVDQLLTYDVVLTTYGTIAKELKKLETFQNANADRNVDYNDQMTAAKFPLLHPTKARFYRVILDEAQCIKNKDTQTAKACHRLRAEYRWCLTGTPMMNGVLELFSLLAFLHIKPYCTWEPFRKQFGVLFGKQGDEKSVAMDTLRALLKAIMLRRKKNSLLDGKPILDLPVKTETVVYAQLSDDERDYYKQLEAKAQVQFSKYLREGSIGRNYSSILVLLLRLRQACCHPHLNLDVTDVSPVTPEQVIELVKQLEPSIVNRIKAAEAFECPICYDAVPSPAFFIPCGHDSCNDCLSRISDTASAMNLQEGQESDKAKCPVCRGPFDPRQCFTYEAFQQVHMPEALKKELKDEDNSDEEEDEVGETDDSDTELDSGDDDVNEKGDLAGFIVDDHFFSESESEEDTKPDMSKIKAESPSTNGTIKAEEEDEKEKLRKAKIKQGKRAQAPKKEKKKRKKAKAQTRAQGKDDKEKVTKVDIKPSMLKELRMQARKSRDAYRRYKDYLRQTWLPAAKVTECIRLLKEAEEQGRKTIVFSQWTLLLDLLEIGIEHENFRHEPKRYDGTMSGDERNAVAKAFQDASPRCSVTVLLVSLRAGNAGLNLTQATRVIIMDPFWNPYIEMQAVDRAYRIGQQRPVEVFRILTQDTVEDRIVELKERKQAIVEAALDEAESAKIGRLGVSELKFLFNRRGD